MVVEVSGGSGAVMRCRCHPQSQSALNHIGARQGHKELGSYGGATTSGALQRHSLRRSTTWLAILAEHDSVAVAI